MESQTLVLVSLLLGFGAGLEEEPKEAIRPGPRAISWEETFAKARVGSTKSLKPLMVDFGAEWCGFCKKLDRETFSDDQVIRLVHESFIAVRVDVDHEPDLGKQFNVEGLPTVLFLAPGGNELQRLEGFQPPDLFLKHARKAAESSAALARLRELATREPGDAAAQQAFARALFASGAVDEAVKVLHAALDGLGDAEAPARAGLLLELGDALQAGKKLSEARPAYERLLAMKPEVGGEARDKAYLPLARVLLGLRDHGAAVKVLDDFLAASSRAREERIEGLYLRGYTHAVRKDADKAVADLKAARDADPEGRWGIRAGAILDLIEGK